METMRLHDLPPHKFEEEMLKKVGETDTNKHINGLITLLEVYVNDFIAMINNIEHTHLQKLSQAMLHGIHAIFLPHEVTGHTGYDPIAYKKMVEGNGIWDFCKEILGWDFQWHCLHDPTSYKKMLRHLHLDAQTFEK